MRTQLQPVRVAYERRNRDLDPQLVWRGKDEQDWSDLVVHAPPLYIQEKVQPKVLIDDLLRDSRQKERAADPQGLLIPDLFYDFNGIPEGADKTDFYQHDQNWSNRMILGDSLQVMASLAEREGLRGKVQCIYFDPPYGIKFNSNFQWSTTSRDVKDGNAGHITREPEQVKAFRDTWRDGIHSYLTYLRDRLTVARDLLTDSGSIFVQIGDENVHRVRAVMDEVFGDDNAGPTIDFKTTAGLASDFLAGSTDHLLWYFKSRSSAKYRRLFNKKTAGEEGATQFTLIQSSDASVVRKFEDGRDEELLEQGWSRLAYDNLTSTGFATTTNYEMLTVTDFGGQLDADMTRQNGHDLRSRATEGGGSWPKESRHGRREGTVPSVCQSRKRTICGSSMIPRRFGAPLMIVSVRPLSCSR